MEDMKAVQSGGFRAAKNLISSAVNKKLAVEEASLSYDELMECYSNRRDALRKHTSSYPALPI
jgi:hypothetical protein